MTRQVQVIIKGLDDLTERVVKKITLDVTANLIETTPVKTGWAKANWVPAIGVRYRGPSGDLMPVSSAEGTQQSAIANVALTYKASRGATFVSNGVFYILELNSGSSKQAPAGFVQRAIHKAITRDIRGLS
jgi:hypothetical protein